MLEAMLIYDYHTNNDNYTNIVQKVMSKRNLVLSDTIDYRKQPFCSINFTLGEVTGNDDWFKGFIAESYTMANEVKKSPEGAILISHQGQHNILIDYLQEYASRLAKTGYLTGDTVFFDECVEQFMIYERLLRDKENGLWHQGRGWCAGRTKISEGAWSRGHGWLLRGLVSSMDYLPAAYQKQLTPLLNRVANALLAVQAESGMWHILLHLPHENSAPDVSGTGMIAYYLAVAVEKSWLPATQFKEPIEKATLAIKNYISDEGEIYNSSKGPGPLCKDEEYKNYIPEKDEKHGAQAVIYGMLAEMILKTY